MRVHRLRATAFGPFTATVDIDGDALAADGLFLLAGPTGAGKSSVLDAICFALYGAVPGRRNEARALRSDLAAPDLAPEVVLDVGLGGRRYRFTRSPAWERPKLRGTGTTTQQASVSVQRLDGGDWTHLTNRLDEAGDLVGRLLGMTCPQFCQVAMLPQGEFQTFLQARSDERQQVLGQLFRTDRYDRVERWLAEHRRLTRREAEARERDVTVAAHLVAEAGGTGVPDDDLADWASCLVVDAATELHAAGAAAGAATSALEAVRASLARARLVAADRDRHAEAAARRAAPAARQPDVAADAHRLDAARRAAAVTGLAQVAESAESARAVAEQVWRGAAGAADLADLVDADLDSDGLDAAVTDVGRRIERLHDAAPVAADLRRERARAAPITERLTADRAALARLDADLVGLPDEVAALRTRHEELGARGATAVAHTDAVTRAVTGRDAARRSVALAEDIDLARAEVQTALETKNELHSSLLLLQERRLTGMAAELAGALTVGADCPVCGSCEHPSPARPAPDAADRAAERDARRALDTAEHELTAHRDRLRGLEVSLAAAHSAAAERDPAAWEADLLAARARLVDAQEAVGERETLAQSLDRADTRLTTAREERGALAVRIVASEAEDRACADAVGRLTAQLGTLLGDHDGRDDESDLVGELRRAEARRAVLVRAAQAAADHDRAVRDAARAHDAAEASAVAHRFDDLAAARAAALDGAEVARIETEAAEHRDAVRDVARLLADPDLRAAAEGPAPDLAAAEAAWAQAEQVSAHAARRQTLATTRVTRLRALTGQLVAALALLAPAEVEATRAAAVADLASGRSADNRYRLSLPAYVLSWRLGQVVAAANVRLARMTDARYVLEHHTDAPTRGNRRGGLDLMVRDEWSGTSRPPATLSGGETFVVSLALALGLADVVTQETDAEALGADIETLFVDEGFGSLDADTLDDVLAVLDELRAGGRVVGVVSHVDGMRERIGTRLEVLNADGGSRVRLVTGA